MKSTFYFLTTILIVSFFMPLSFAQETKDYNDWWNEGYPRIPRNNPSAKKLPLIQVKGNKFVNTNGDTILFRGLSISDPDKVEKQGHWKKKHFEKVKRWAQWSSEFLFIQLHGESELLQNI